MTEAAQIEKPLSSPNAPYSIYLEELGLVHEEAGDIGAALQVLEELTDARSGVSVGAASYTRLLVGDLYLRNGDVQRARRVLLDVLDETPRTPSNSMLLETVAQKLGGLADHEEERDRYLEMEGRFRSLRDVQPRETTR